MKLEDEIQIVIELVSKRAGQLATVSMDELRSMYPIETETQNEAIRYCKDMRLLRSELIESILNDEFEGRGEEICKNHLTESSH